MFSKIIWIILIFIITTVPINASNGYLLIKHSDSRLFICKNGKQAPLFLPIKSSYSTKYLLNSKNELIAFGKSRIALLNLKNGKTSLHKQPSKGELVRYIGKNKKFIFITHGYYRAALTFQNFNGKRKRSWAYNRWLANKFTFLPDGRHLFCHTSGMGKKESSFYIDLVLGKKQTLYYVPGIGKKPKALLKKRAFFHPRFVNKGKDIVFLSPGYVNKSRNLRTFKVGVYNLASGRVRTLNTIRSTVFNKSYQSRRRTYNRATPSLFVFYKSPWIAFRKGKAYKFINVLNNKSISYSPEDGYYVMKFFPTSGRKYYKEDTSIFPYIVLKKSESLKRYSIKVLSIPDFKTVFTHTFRGPACTTAVFIPGLNHQKLKKTGNVNFNKKSFNSKKLYENDNDDSNQDMDSDGQSDDDEYEHE